MPHQSYLPRVEVQLPSDYTAAQSKMPADGKLAAVGHADKMSKNGNRK